MFESYQSPCACPCPCDAPGLLDEDLCDDEWECLNLTRVPVPVLVPVTLLVFR